jgi:PhoH-like ATPase
VIIPLTAVEVLEGLEKESGELSRSASYVLGLIDSFRKKGDINRGVKLEGGGLLLVADYPKKILFKEKTPVNKMISLAVALKNRYENVVIVSKAAAVRIKATVKGISSEDYLKDKTSTRKNSAIFISPKAREDQ